MYEWTKRILIFLSLEIFPYPQPKIMVCCTDRSMCLSQVIFFFKLLWTSLFYKLAKKSFIGLHSFARFWPLKKLCWFHLIWEGVGVGVWGRGWHIPLPFSSQNNMWQISFLLVFVCLLVFITGIWITKLCSFWQL